MAIDAADNVYVADQVNHRIQKFSSTGAYITQWGSYGVDDGRFNNPEGVEIDAAGDVYVADTYNHRVQKFTYSSSATASTWGRVKATYRD